MFTYLDKNISLNIDRIKNNTPAENALFDLYGITLAATFDPECVRFAKSCSLEHHDNYIRNETQYKLLVSEIMAYHEKELTPYEKKHLQPITNSVFSFSSRTIGNHYTPIQNWQLIKYHLTYYNINVPTKNDVITALNTRYEEDDVSRILFYSFFRLLCINDI